MKTGSYRLTISFVNLNGCFSHSIKTALMVWPGKSLASCPNYGSMSLSLLRWPFNIRTTTVAVLSQPSASPNFHNTLISSAFRGLAAGLHQAIEVHDAGSESEFRDLAQLMKTGGFHSFRIVPVSTQRHTHTEP